MIKINLLPPEEKENLKLQETRRWIIFYGNSILISSGFFAALLIIVLIFVSTQLKNANLDLAAAQTSFQGQDLKAQQDLIKDLDNKLAKIDKMQKEKKQISDILISLSNITPEETRLNSLSINNKNELVISGFAKNRENIIRFKEILENSSLFENIENPLSNLIKQTDIDFTFNMKISQKK